jgi:hypothetical protein
MLCAGCDMTLPAPDHVSRATSRPEVPSHRHLRSVTQRERNRPQRLGRSATKREKMRTHVCGHQKIRRARRLRRDAAEAGLLRPASHGSVARIARRVRWPWFNGEFNPEWTVPGLLARTPARRKLAVESPKGGDGSAQRRSRGDALRSPSPNPRSTYRRRPRQCPPPSRSITRDQSP